MRDRLVTYGLATAAVLVVLSWMVPSLLPGAAVPPAPRVARVPEPVAARPGGAVGFSVADLRLGDPDPMPVGAIGGKPGAARGGRAELSARVVVKAEQAVAISAEINARIVAMPFREGERFGLGATLVEFDCQRIRAELAAAQAALNLHRNALETTRQLARLGSAGIFNVRQAQFEADKAAADVDNLKAKQATCVIRAPFAGVVAEKLATAHEVASPNQPLLRIVDTAAPELQLIVPSDWLGWLEAGLGFTVELDENRRRYAARVASVAGAVDPVSQTVRVIARFEGDAREVTAGMSGIANFAPVGGAR